MSSTPLQGQNYEIGRFTYFSKDLQLRTWLPEERICIGSFCSIADRVVICAGGQHRRENVSSFPLDKHFQADSQLNRSYQTTENTIIENDVWIGTGAMILGGVHIGNGAVISARSVVFEDVPPYAVAAGNPAKVIRYRFSKGAVQKLLAIQWWTWSDEKIKENLEWFYRPISEFVDHFFVEELENV